MNDEPNAAPRVPIIPSDMIRGGCTLCEPRATITINDEVFWVIDITHQDHCPISALLRELQRPF